MSTSTQTYVAVIDDESRLCTALSRLLRVEGFQPIAYLSAEAFLADAKRPQFDCLVVDIRLGGMSGLDLLRQLAAHGPHAPVIIITAFDDPDMRSQAVALGCAAFFRKRAPGSEIVDAIRRATLSKDSTLRCEGSEDESDKA